MRQEINEYYAARGLKEPDSLEALMWLVSEVGELVEAYCETVMVGKLFPDNTIDVNNRDDVVAYGKLRWLITACKNVETDAARRPGWTRNNQPSGTYDIPGEIGDILMMLEKFAEKMLLPESGECLRTKMARKIKEMK